MIDIETMQYVYATVIEATGQEELLENLTPANFQKLDKLVVAWYREQGYNVETIEDVWIRENQHQRAQLGKIMQLQSYIVEPNGTIVKLPKWSYAEAVSQLYEQEQPHFQDYPECRAFTAKTTITGREQQLVQFYELQGYELNYYLGKIDAIQYPENY